MPATATVTVCGAIVAACLANGTLSALLAGDKVYLRRPVDPNAPLPYIVLGPAGERDASRYGEPGHEGDESPRCWGRFPWDADAVYAALYPVLHNVTLSLSGHRTVRGKLSRITDLPDPSGTAHQVVARYRILTRET